MLIYNQERMKRQEAGYTLVELLVTIVVLSIISLGIFNLFVSLLHSAIVSTRQAVALTLATNQMEYVKSLPYDNLAVAGGAIVATQTIPATVTKTVNGDTYVVTTSIVYADDAYDGCGSYPTTALKQKYCRNYPAPTGAPNPDTNPGDYKDVNVSVTDKFGTHLAELDTHVAALVAETSSNTGALFVSVIDESGNPISGATVTAVNSSTAPAVNVSDTTDTNGIVIFYDLPPSTTGNKYVITATKGNYSSITTIAPTGTLTPTYSSQNLIAQNSAYATLTIKLQGTNSLVIETTDTNGNPISNAKVYVKGGYKKYTATSDTSYYFDNKTPSDTRVATDASGQVALTNLVPGGYYFCGDNGDTSCTVGSTTYYLAAAVPYGGTDPLEPVNVPIYDPSNPPAVTFNYNGGNYLQKVRLILTTNSAFPRVFAMTPNDASKASGTLSNFAFVLTGQNLPCSASPSSCTTQVSFLQNGNTYTAACTGTSGTSINCTVDIAAADVGLLQLVVSVGSNTLTLPGGSMQGGILVTP